jgi:opine dehydrogenase
MNVQRVAVLGAGNGGIPAAADLKLRGFEVALFELPQFSKNLDMLQEKGSIQLKEADQTQKVSIDFLTTDITQALDGAQMVLITIPATWIESFSKICAPHIGQEQIVMLHTAACMGSLRFVKAAREIGVSTDFKIGEFSTLAYGTRAFPEKGEVELLLRVKEFYFAGYPATRTAEIAAPCQQVYPTALPVENIWATTLTNGNPEVHPGPSVVNAGRIDYSKGEFWLYVEGITKHTFNVLMAVNDERVALGRALNLELDDCNTARKKRGYLVDGPEEWFEKYNSSPVFSKVKGPESLDSRYVTEDIANGLVLYSSLGSVLGVPTPASDAIITLGGILLQRDFMAEGVTLERLGLAGKRKEELLKAVNETAV